MTDEQIALVADAVRSFTIAALKGDQDAVLFQSDTIEVADCNQPDGWVTRRVRSRSITITLTPPEPKPEARVAA
jgi:hypothetical protein